MVIALVCVEGRDEVGVGVIGVGITGVGLEGVAGAVDGGVSVEVVGVGVSGIGVEVGGRDWWDVEVVDGVVGVVEAGKVDDEIGLATG